MNVKPALRGEEPTIFSEFYGSQQVVRAGTGVGFHFSSLNSSTAKQLRTQPDASSRTSRRASEWGRSKAHLGEGYNLVHPRFSTAGRVVQVKLSSVQVEGNLGALAAGQV